MTKQKPWKPDFKNNDYWGIVSKDGWVMVTSMQRTRQSAVLSTCSKLNRSWQALKNQGYRAVKIRIVEMD